MKVLEINDIFFNYEEDKELIKKVSFNLLQNEFLSIVGTSGCGKTTIIKIIDGIKQQSSGTITGLKTAYMPQQDLLLPWRNVLENILLPVELNKKSIKKGTEKARFYLNKFGLEGYEKQTTSRTFRRNEATSFFYSYFFNGSRYFIAR